MSKNMSLAIKSFVGAPLPEKEVISFLQEQNFGAYHGVSTSELEHVVSRVPFRRTAEMQMMLRGIDPATIAEKFLRHAYPHLPSVDYSISASPSENGATELNELAGKSEKSGLLDHANLLRRDYGKLQGLRWLFGEMQARNLLATDSILPISDLPGTVFAEPVWFIKKTGSKGKQSVDDQRLDNRRYFQRLLPKEFAQTFFLFNPLPRLLREFSTVLEAVPVPIMEVMEVGDLVFDHVAITTPYHDLAVGDWKSPQKFLRSMDPEVFGFIDGLPWFFRMGQWSGNGFLAHKCAQIATTAWVISQSRDDIRRFIESLFDREWRDNLVIGEDWRLFETGVIPIVNYYSRENQIAAKKRSFFQKAGRLLNYGEWK